MRCALWLTLVCGTVAAQDRMAELKSALIGPDPVAAEIARRQLAAMPRDRVPVEFLTRLLRHNEPERVWAAASVLLRHDEGRAALAAARPPNQAYVRELLLEVASDDELRVAVRTSDVGGRALWVLEERGRLDHATLVAALQAERLEVARTAQDVLVWRQEFALEIADAVTESERGRGRLLDALTLRPRVDAEPWVQALLRDPELGPVDRLRAFAASTTPLTLDQGREILAAAAGEARDPRQEALEAATLLPVSVADKLVAEVHRRALDGHEIDYMLPCLSNISTKGARHLLGLARALELDQREEIANWLTLRNAELVDQLVVEALDGHYPMVPYLVQRSGALLTTDARQNRVVSLLTDESVELRVAAFRALVAAGTYHPAMLDYALQDPNDAPSRVRKLLAAQRMPLPEAAYDRMLGHESPAIIKAALSSLGPGPTVLDLEPKLLRLIATDDIVAHTAVRTLFQYGRSEAVRRLWGGMTAEEREQVVTALKGRREPWVPEMLGEARADEPFAVLYTRMHLGDRDAVDLLLADIPRWPLPWLRRCEDPVVAALTDRDLAVLEPLLGGPNRLDVPQRENITGWLGARPDLACAPLLQRLLDNDDAEEVRYEALRGLLRRPEGLALRRSVEESIGTVMTESQRDLAYEVIGAMDTPLTRDDATLLARLMLIAPMGDPRDEVSQHLPRDRSGSFPDLPLLNMTWQLMRRGVSDEVAAAYAEVVESAAADPRVWALGRRRLGGVLTMFARSDATRHEIAPGLAELILASADSERTFVGPAWLILAERAELDGRFEAAATAYRNAALAIAQHPPAPLVLRTYVGDDHRGSGELPAAMLAAKPHVCRARAAHRRGDRGAALAELAVAARQGYGDYATQAEIEELVRELDK